MGGGGGSIYLGDDVRGCHPISVLPGRSSSKPPR